MGWFEKIGLTPPTEKEIGDPDREELISLERNLNQERQELSEFLADIYDEADELGIDLDNGYDAAGNESYQIVKQKLLVEQRARIAMALEETEETLSALAKLHGRGREVEA
jgi:hypothetical protein